MSGRRRGLTEEDKALWAHVVEQVTPLKRRRRKVPKPAVKSPLEPPGAEPPRAEAAAHKPRPLHPPAAPKPPPVPPAIPPLAPIDRHERRRLVRGTRGIDGRIDLHGMRQAEAHVALRGFLMHAQMRGDTLVLVITGKGQALAGRSQAGPHSSFEDERGVLRRVVPQWLRLPDLRPFVVGFEEAHVGHGGAGALYIRLRRGRKADPR